MRGLIRTTLLLAPLAATACGFDFESKGILLDRRILAIQAEPPELIINGPSVLTQSVQFRALVADPNETTEPQAFEWRACVPTLNSNGNYDVTARRCAETDKNAFGSGSSPLSDLKVTLTPQEVLNSLNTENGGLASLLGAFGGGMTGGGSAGGDTDPKKTPAFTVLMMTQLKVADDSPTPLYGVKQIPLSLLGGVVRPANKNPQLTALLFDGKPWEPGTPLPLKLGQCTNDKKVDVVDKHGPKNARGQRPTVTVCEHRVTPVYDDAQAETYEAQTFDRDADGNYLVEKAMEHLRFDWTITDNGTLSDNTTEPNTSIGPKIYDPISVKWREPPRLKGDSLRLWVVVRDGRGGESWETRQLSLSQ